LEPWAPRIGELAEQSDEVHVLMNNCYEDYAVVNARQLGGAAGLDEPTWF